MNHRLAEPPSRNWSPQTPGPAVSPTETRRWLLGLCALALLSRGLMLWQLGPLCCDDAYYYVFVADAMDQGDLTGALGYLNLNIYPHVLSGLHSLGLDWIFAGQLWGLLASSAVILPMYGWSRRFFNDRIARLTCFLYAVHPEFIELSVEPVREQTFWLLTSLAIFYGWRAMETLRRRDFIWAGLATGLAIHTRSEGWLLLIPMTIWMAGRCRRERSKAFLLGRRGLLWASMTPTIIVAINLVLLPQQSEWHWGRLTHFRDCWDWLVPPAETDSPLPANATGLPQTPPSSTRTLTRPANSHEPTVPATSTPSAGVIQPVVHVTPQLAAATTDNTAPINAPRMLSPEVRDEAVPLQQSPSKSRDNPPSPPELHPVVSPLKSESETSQQYTESEEKPAQLVESLAITNSEVLSLRTLFTREFVNTLEPVNLILMAIGLVWTLRIQFHPAYAGITIMACGLLAAIAILNSHLGMTNGRYFLTVYLLAAPQVAVGFLVLLSGLQITFTKLAGNAKSLHWLPVAMLPLALFGMLILGWTDALTTRHIAREAEAAVGQSLRMRYGPFKNVAVDKCAKRPGHFASDQLPRILPESDQFPEAVETADCDLVILCRDNLTTDQQQQICRAGKAFGFQAVDYQSPALARHSFMAFLRTAQSTALPSGDVQLTKREFRGGKPVKHLPHHATSTSN